MEVADRSVVTSAGKLVDEFFKGIALSSSLFDAAQQRPMQRQAAPSSLSPTRTDNRPAKFHVTKHQQYVGNA
jgi:hypothetical protein